MHYKDQFIPNGRLSQSGYRLMDNVAKSYRMGIELIGGYQICNFLRLDANLTLSQNKILDYHVIEPIMEVVSESPWIENHTGKNIEYTLKSSDLAFSPNVVGAGVLTFSPIENLNIMLTGKYVGKQFFDNFSTKEHQLDAYFVTDLGIRYEFPLNNRGQRIYVQGAINNLFNKDYINNAYTFKTHYVDRAPWGETRFFVQAPIHFSIKLGIKL
jgi:iron complex outermembrane receptor protein